MGGASQSRRRHLTPVTYKVVFRDEARKAFTSLDHPVRKRIAKLLDRLAENPRPGQATQLVTDPGTYRVRTGDWRVLYEIHDEELVVLVLEVGHRSTVY
jgi:mRNA interferase RelE/StbE